VIGCECLASSGSFLSPQIGCALPRKVQQLVLDILLVLTGQSERSRLDSNGIDLFPRAILLDRSSILDFRLAAVSSCLISTHSLTMPDRLEETGGTGSITKLFSLCFFVTSRFLWISRWLEHFDIRMTTHFGELCHQCQEIERHADVITSKASKNQCNKRLIDQIYNTSTSTLLVTFWSRNKQEQDQTSSFAHPDDGSIVSVGIQSRSSVPT